MDNKNTLIEIIPYKIKVVKEERDNKDYFYYQIWHIDTDVDSTELEKFAEFNNRIEALEYFLNKLKEDRETELKLLKEQIGL